MCSAGSSFVWQNDKVKFENDDLLPSSSIRGIVCGDSGSGKTHLLFKLLLEDYLDYNRLYIFSNSIYQSEYQLLIEGFKAKLKPSDIWFLLQNCSKFPEKDPKESVKKMVDEYKAINKQPDYSIEVFAYKDIALIPLPENVDKKYKNLFIFDDCMMGKQGTIAEYYTRGRHSNVQCFYITQNYFRLPRHSIRGNANLLILFKLNKVDLANVYRDIASQDIEEYRDFEQFSKKVWDRKYEYMVIDRFNEDINWRYRKGFKIPYNKVMK